MRTRLEAWIVKLSEDLWPRHWPRGLRLFATGAFTGLMILFVVYTSIMVYSVLAG